jgi:trehalose 6-phosphate phosphatase
VSSLDPELRAALGELAGASRLLVALDFDGVLAPIVPVPSDARPLPASADALRGLAARPDTLVALVSGRGLADLRAVSGAEPPVRLVGSHGGEFDDGEEALDDAQRARLEELVEQVKQLVDGEPGVTLEAKPAGVAVHIRNAAPEVGTRVLDAVRTGPAAGQGIESTPGKAVLDLSVMETSKGSAVDVLRERFEADAVLFAGDDVTDETAFKRLRSGDVGVKVGDGDTAARYRVADPQAMADLLTELCRSRS